MSYIVKFYDYSALPENVVYDPNAPLHDEIVVADAAEAFEYAIAFGDEFSVSMEPVA